MPNNVPESEMKNHATISKSGEVDFPLWVKVIAWILGLCVPIAVLAGTWMISAMVDMSIRMARIEASLAVATENRYTETQAADAHQLMNQRIDRNAQDIEILRQKTER